MLVEGGHYTLAQDGSPILSETTIRTFAGAACETAALRRAGSEAMLGLMVGDLALPAGERLPGGSWGLPAAYRDVLAEAGLGLVDVRVWTESYARNQGKRRLLDEARRRCSGPETYAKEGWGFFVSTRGDLALVSDASLCWEGEVRSAVVARGLTPLCPLIFAGLKRAVFQAGFRSHVAHYALNDDPWIDVKLQSAAAAFTQLRHGRVGVQLDRLYVTSGAPRSRVWLPDDLVAPGEEPWERFIDAVRRVRPDLTPLDPMETPWRPNPHPVCSPSAIFRCSG